MTLHNNRIDYAESPKTAVHLHIASAQKAPINLRSQAVFLHTQNCIHKLYTQN